MSVKLRSVDPGDSGGGEVAASFSDLLKSELASQASSKCRSCRWYDSLDSDAKAAFDECAAARPQGYIAALYSAGKLTGLDVVFSTFKDHMFEHHHKRRDR